MDRLKLHTTIKSLLSNKYSKVLLRKREDIGKSKEIPYEDLTKYKLSPDLKWNMKKFDIPPEEFDNLLRKGTQREKGNLVTISLLNLKAVLDKEAGKFTFLERTPIPRDKKPYAPLDDKRPGIPLRTRLRNERSQRRRDESEYLRKKKSFLKKVLAKLQEQ